MTSSRQMKRNHYWNGYSSNAQYVA